MGFDAPCSAWPPAFLYQVRLAATIDSVLLGLFEGLKYVAIRYGGRSARTASQDEGQALLAIARVGSLCLAPVRRAETQTDKTGSKEKAIRTLRFFFGADLPPTRWREPSRNRETSGLVIEFGPTRWNVPRRVPGSFRPPPNSSVTHKQRRG